MTMDTNVRIESALNPLQPSVTTRGSNGLTKLISDNLKNQQKTTETINTVYFGNEGHCK